MAGGIDRYSSIPDRIHKISEIVANHVEPGVGAYKDGYEIKLHWVPYLRELFNVPDNLSSMHDILPVIYKFIEENAAAFAVFGITHSENFFSIGIKYNGKEVY